MSESTKRFLYLMLEDQEGLDKRARWVRAFLVILIMLNVLAVIVETMESVSLTYRHWFRNFEYFSVAIFTMEYLARLWVCTGCAGNGGGIKGRIKHALHPLMLVDLLAIVPFYLPLFFTIDLIFLRALRLMRLLRVLKLGRYSDAIQVFYQVIRLKREQLAIAAIGLFIMLIISASLMYFFEHQAQPEIFGSIPHAMWWAIITLTTVGYGDTYPITLMGRILASSIALLGIGMFALPAGILSSGFVEYQEMQSAKTKLCPHCGKTLEERSGSDGSGADGSDSEGGTCKG